MDGRRGPATQPFDNHRIRLATDGSGPDWGGGEAQSPVARLPPSRAPRNDKAG